MSPRRIAVVVSGFPRRSETFAVSELLGLADRGLLAAIYALKRGEGVTSQPGVERLMPFVHDLSDTGTDEQPATIARLLAGQRVGGVHAYFAHAPAAVAERAAWHLSVPFGFSVHAKDARKVATHTLRARAARAACVVACNRDVAGDLQRIGAASHLVPHGVDLTRFAPAPHVPHEGFRVLAVGRLVEKKGFDVLVDALAATPPLTSLRIVGDGPRRVQLTHQIAARGLGDRVTLVDSCTHSTLPAEYAAADAVVVPSVVDGSGDRDGLPNVVLEAMACARAVVGTRAGAIEAAIRQADTGLLVTPGCAASIAAALRTLAGNAQLRDHLGRRARAAVEREYDVNRCVERFAGVLEAAYA